MKFVILSENSNGAWPYLYVRSMGPYELRRRIEEQNHQATIIEWFTFWSDSELKLVIESYFKDEANPVIAISTPFNSADVHKIKQLLIWAKDKYPNLKIIHGGSRTYDEQLSDIIDVFFLGRSMKMFDDWLMNKDLSMYTSNTNPLVLNNTNFDQDIDNPVIPILKDDDFLIDKDIIGFEIGVGCKFNCTFCKYELRNAKITKTADVYELRNYFDIAYNKYGIDNFFTGDDTLNETDEKLEIIAEAISSLNYHPKISAFTRLDIITGRKQQIDLLEKIQFESLFFGIESFNPEASKLIRKKSGLGNVYDTLKEIKRVSPNTFTVGGIIVGLNKDSAESIYQSIDRIIEEGLLSSLEFYPLHIAKANGLAKDDFHSEIEKDPERFGYVATDVIDFYQNNKKVSIINWKSDWSDFKSATKLSDELNSYCNGKISQIGHLEYAGFRSIGVLKDNTSLNTTREILNNRAFFISKQLKDSYIKKKLKHLTDNG